MAATRTGIEVKFADVMRQAAETLKTKDTAAALRLVEEFFVANQADLKTYFDAKSLEETKHELEKRVSEVKEVVGTVGIADMNKVPEFLSKLKDLFMEEYRKREDEMAES